MKKWMKIVLIVLAVWLSIFLVDFICVKTIKRPIFMIRTTIYKDGGTKEYYGLGYKVIKCNTLSSCRHCFLLRKLGGFCRYVFWWINSNDIKADNV